MKLIFVALVVTGCLGSERELSGTYHTNYNGTGDATCGDGTAVGSCIEVTACDATGLLDRGYFHDPTIEGHFAVHVPEGATDVHLKWHQYTFDHDDRILTGVVDGPVHDNLELGLIVISSWPPAPAPPSGAWHALSAASPCD